MKRLLNPKLKSKKINILSFYITFIMFSLIPAKSNLSQAIKEISPIRFESHSSEINIKVNTAGYQYILGENYPFCPNEIFIDGEPVDTVGGNCRMIYIPESALDNYITLYWIDSLTSLQSIFDWRTNIIEIDLSSFDSSYVVDMTDMFYGCSSLTSINFSNLNTALVEDMQRMFYDCDSLTELDLSSFITSKVTTMANMFKGCSNLKILNIESFDTSNVVNMQKMFNLLESIEYLDLSNFNTSKVITMESMFSNCRNLTSLNLLSFNTSIVTDMSNMFSDDISLEFINLSNFNTSNVISMNLMFKGCVSLTSLVLSSFDTVKVIDMSYMFYNCRKILYLNLSNFKTPNLKVMYSMFFGCKSLISLNITNFDTSLVTDMYDLFALNEKLIELDLSFFNTSNVVEMSAMFYECNSITFLNLSNFDASKSKSLEMFFYNCYSLSNIDLTNFNTNNIEMMSFMFYHCNSLTSLNLLSFNTESTLSMDEMFYKCQSLTSLNLSNFYTPNLISMYQMFDTCSSLIYLDVSNFNTENVFDLAYIFNFCFSLENLKIKFNTSNARTMEGMFYECSSLIYLDLSSFNTEKVQDMRNMFYNCKKLIELNLSNFDTSSLTCAINMFGNCFNIEYINFEKYNDLNNININNILEGIRENIVICINEDHNIDRFKEIIELKLCPTISCENDWKAQQKKIIVDTMTCAENCDGFLYENNNMCFSTCPEQEDFCQNKLTENTITTTDSTKEEGNLISIDIYSSNIESDFEIIPTSRDIMILDSTNNNFITETIINNFKYNIIGETDEEIYYNIIEDLLKNYNNLNNKDVGLIIEGKGDFFFQITNTDIEKYALKEKNITNKEFSIIDLGECENILKDYYNIDKNTILIIIKYEKIVNNTNDRLIQYEVYEPLNIKKLNLSICEIIPINIYTPFILSEDLNNLYNDLKAKGYNLFNINSSFYQDICTPFKSSNGTDVILSDRINYYYNNQETICQSNCKFDDYLYEEQLLKCKCNFENSEIKPKEIKKFNKKSLYQIFYDTLKFSNYKVLKCYKLVFNINSITINKGSIITIIYFSFYLILFIIYCFKGINQLKIEFIKRMSFQGKKFNEKIKKESKRIVKNNDYINGLSIKSSTTRMSKRKKSSLEDIKLNSPNKKSRMSNLLKRKSATPSIKNLEIYSNFINKNLLITNKKSNINKIQEKNGENEIKINNIPDNEIKEDNKEEKLDDFELNNLDYNDAIKLDKRSFINIYWSIIKREHLILFTFFIRKDHNIIYVKVSRFIFLICTDMALNVFFFADETMHKMFLDYGKYNFFQQIPQIIYSTLASQLIELLLCYLCLTDKYFYQIKNLNNKSKYKIFHIIRCIKIKLSFFLAFTFIMLAFYWYAIACFCAVYENTQMAFIKDSLLSFCLSLLYPFVLYLIPSFLRIISLRANKSNLSFLYKLSDVIPIF